ncbi:hypothetical protein [Pseudochrobactrum sp. B5]|uniref:hypothetical protein n=1 Tax=Pseudochrobactrum sp. B5 TaxID=1289478 RepID=UPI001587FE52|nr:hypothetical protein [Pseudochrobactrum sp. B5]
MGKNSKGRKHYIMVDTLVLLDGLATHFTGMQDRDRAPDALKAILKPWPCLRHIFADGG